MKNLKNISLATWVRMLFVTFALVNQILTTYGFKVLPIDESSVEQLVTSGLLFVTVISAAWKNNSFTKEAQEAQAYLDARRAEKVLGLTTTQAPAINSTPKGSDIIVDNVGSIEETSEEVKDITVSGFGYRSDDKEPIG